MLIPTCLLDAVSVYISLIQFQILLTSLHSQIKHGLSPFLPGTLTHLHLHLLNIVFSCLFSGSIRRNRARHVYSLCLLTQKDRDALCCFPGIFPSSRLSQGWGPWELQYLEGRFCWHLGERLPLTISDFISFSELISSETSPEVELWPPRREPRPQWQYNQHPALVLHSWPWSSNCFWRQPSPRPLWAVSSLKYQIWVSTVFFLTMSDISSKINGSIS